MDMLLWFPQKVCRTWKVKLFRKLFVGSLILPTPCEIRRAC
jgi:hypothetical protein